LQPADNHGFRLEAEEEPDDVARSFRLEAEEKPDDVARSFRLQAEES
jgi:hypothetical protein